MSDAFIGQIMLTGFNFAPQNYALCDGQLMSIAQNQALFSLLGTQYGGNGTTTFALPDLRSRVPVGSGSSADPGWHPPPYSMGDRGGLTGVSLVDANLPAHSHAMVGTTAAGAVRNPSGNLYGNSGSEPLFGPATGAQVALSSQNLGMAGGGQSHQNMQPYQVVSFAIALSGVFPSRN